MFNKNSHLYAKVIQNSILHEIVNLFCFVFFKCKKMKESIVKISVILVSIIFFHQKLCSQSKDSIVVVGQRAKSAEFPGGQAKMYQFIAHNIEYPKDAHTCTKGIVFVHFCVEIDGSLTNIKVVRGLCKECNTEAIRVIGIMPKWFPALDKDTQKPVKSYITLPCRFGLD